MWLTSYSYNYICMLLGEKISKISTPDQKAKIQRLEKWQNQLEKKSSFSSEIYYKLDFACDHFVIIFKYVSVPTTAYAHG